MSVTIKKPDTHRREYAYFELPNKLKAVVGSDPACDKAGAALTVNVGMCYERKDLPGLAHFLEHMLFTGTKKYPKEGEYMEFIKQNAGTTNANTACYVTNYMFEIKPEALEPALDRFARFFTEPLLTRDCTDREINAVDSEFQAGHTMPWWRYIGIMHMSANPGHPFHVAVGNNKVLKDEPKERGMDLYDEMIKLYNEFYSANGMTVCVIGKESISELEAMVREKFGAVVDKGLSLPLGDAVSQEPPFLPKDWNRLLLQCPVKDIKELKFSWVIPYQAPLWKSKPAAYASHLLGHEGKGSLTAVLKDRGIISGCSTSRGAWLEGAFSLFHVSFDLTDSGVHEVAEIGKLLFTYIGMLQRVDVKVWILEEMQKLREVQFRFGEDRRPFDLAAQIAGSMQHHPAAEVLAGPSQLYELDPSGTAALLKCLTLEGVRVTHQAKVLADRCTDRDTSYDSPMKFEPLDASWLQIWSEALNSGDSAEKAGAALGLRLPEPNLFIPEDLSLKAPAAQAARLPSRLPGTTKLVGYVFHRQDDVFKQPKARIHFNIRSPFICKNVQNYVKVSLWTRIVEEALADYSYDADVAGLRYSLGVSSSALTLAFSGFHDKLGVLIEAVAKKMREIGAKRNGSVPENLFKIVADSYGDQLRNAAFHSRPISQCAMRASELLGKGSGFPVEQMYEAFGETKRESLDGLSDVLFRTCHVEAFVLGNATPDDARALAKSLEKSLALKRPLDVLPEVAEAALPPGRTVWSLDSTDKDDPNHAVLMRLQLSKSVEDSALLSVLCKILGSKFFDVLRTQQQLGYIVGMGSTVGLAFNYLVAQVQTEFPPDYTRGRIDAFFDEHFAWLECGITEEEFTTCCDGVLSELKTKPKNLAEEYSSFSREFSQRTYSFDRKDKLIAHIESGKVNLAALQTFVKERVLAAPRIYIQVKKVLEKEDKPLPDGAKTPDDPPELRRWNGYETGGKEFETFAKWFPMSKTVVPAQSLIKLRKPKFGKVKDLHPESRGVNLILKVLKCEELEKDKPGQSVIEASCGDQTGIVSLRLKADSQVNLALEAAVQGSCIRVQNAKVSMLRGYIRITIDKWGKLAAADEAIDGEVDLKNNISAVEYELADR